MHTPWQERTRLLLGESRADRLARASVLIVGTGGVGAYAAELLCRAGVGRLVLVDADTVAASNINRQLPALHSTVGLPKVDVLARRFRDINPALDLDVRRVFLNPEDMAPLLESEAFDFIVDAIDSVASKCALLAAALRRGVRIVSSMGAGAKTDVTQVRLADLWKTYHCPLAKAVRQRLSHDGLRGRRLPVVFSAQPPDRHAVVPVEGEAGKRTTTGTVSYMPATFGCFLAGYVVEHL